MKQAILTLFAANELTAEAQTKAYINHRQYSGKIWSLGTWIEQMSNNMFLADGTEFVGAIARDADTNSKSATTYYEITEGNGCTGKNGKYAFDTEDEAVEVAREFKSNPRSHNEKMEDKNVEYWQNKDYTIQRKTIITKQLQTI